MLFFMKKKTNLCEIFCLLARTLVNFSKKFGDTCLAESLRLANS